MDELTPLPWHAYPIEDGSWCIVRTFQPPHTASKIALSVANANVLSAAPELLEALIDMVSAFDEGHSTVAQCCALGYAKIVLGKAKG